MSDVLDRSPGSALIWVELAESLRALEGLVLPALQLLPRVGPDISASDVLRLAVSIREDDAAKIRRLCDQIAEVADRVRIGRERSVDAALDLRGRDLEEQAGHALAGGVADVWRASLLCRCMRFRPGCDALATSLRETDAREHWHGTLVADLMMSFHRADARVVGKLLELAMLPGDARWDACEPEQVARLADVLTAYSSSVECR